MEQFKGYMRIVATVMISLQCGYYMFAQPGPMDTYNGLTFGAVMYCLWRKSK